MQTPAGRPVAVILALARAIGRAQRVEDIYATALDALADGLAVDRSSILLFDADGVMRFKASRGLSDIYRRAVEGHSPWTPGARDAEPIVVSDVTQDASLLPFLPTCCACNLKVEVGGEACAGICRCPYFSRELKNDSANPL